MNKTLLTLMFWVGFAIALTAQPILTEDFSTATGATPPAGWTQNVIAGDTAFDEWRFDNPGSLSVGSPVSDPFAVFDSDDYSSGGGPENVALESPPFDASAFTTISLEFDHFFLEGFGGEYNVEVFDGTSWVSVLSGTTSTTNPQSDSIDISAQVAGVSNAQVRFRWVGDFSFFWAVDNVNIFAPAANDVGVVSIIEPVSSCAFSNAVPVTVRIFNFGTAPQTGFPVGYQVGLTGTPVIETYTGPPIMQGMTATYTFATTADLSAPGTYDIGAVTGLTGDADNTNDTATTSVVNITTTPVTLPFVEDFETFPLNATYANGWTVGPNSDADWLGKTGATGSTGTGPTGDNTTGNGNYLYTEATGPVQGDVFSIITPCIELTGAQNPELSYFYHMYGADMGDLEVYLISDGQSFLIDTLIGEQQIAGADPYLESRVDLSAFTGTIQIEFRGIRGADFTSDISIDDVSIVEVVNTDLAVTDLVAPTPTFGCFGNNEVVIASVENVGMDNVDFATTNATVTLNVSGANTGTYTATLNAGTLTTNQTINAQFPGVDLSVPGSSDFSITVAFPGDGVAGNDTLIDSVFTQPTITSFPYVEDFESGPGGWIAGGSASSWAFGTPAKNTITGANSGFNAWTTGGLGTGNYNSGENSAVLSPCFDFTTLTTPSTVSLAIWYESENSFDGAVLQSSIDGGATWQNVGAFGDPNNWYTDNTISGNPGGQQEGWTGRDNTSDGSGGWVQAENVLDSSLLGQADVRFRIAFGSDGSVNDDGFAFDDFMIEPIPAADPGIVGLVQPAGSFGCFGNNETLMLDIDNSGIDTIDFSMDSLVVSLVVSGANTGTYDTVLTTGTIGPGQVVGVDLTGVNLSNVGTSTLDFSLTFVGDGDSTNNDLSVSLITQPIIATYPYFEDFEGGEGGWVSTGFNNTWAFGTPNKETIQGAGSGSNAWVTGGLDSTSYSFDENSAVFSPCFDMTNAPLGAFVALKIWWQSESGFDGAVLQTSVDSGATWQNVGGFGAPNNWFNNDDIDGEPGGSLIGWTGRFSTFSSDGSGGWVQAFHPLDSSLIGASDVRFRVAFGSDGSVQDDGFAFDDFGIGLPPSLDFGADSAGFCIGDSLDAGPGGVSYSWSTGDSVQQIAILNATGTTIVDSTISVVVENEIGISVSDTVVATIFASLPSAQINTVQNVACFGDSTGGVAITVSGDAPFTYLWSNGDTTQDLTGLLPGTYDGIITDANGCTSDIPEATITEPAAAVTVDLDSIVDAVCATDSGTINITVTGGTAPYTFLWDNGATDEDVRVPVGTYTGTITDANGCVLISPELTVSNTDSVPTTLAITQTTAGAEVTFTGDASGATSFAWDFGDGTGTSTDQNPVYMYQQDGQFIVTLTATNDCGSTTLTDTVNMTTVTIDPSDIASVEVYPNPNGGTFSVKFDGLVGQEINVKVLSIEGKEIYAQALGNVNGSLTQPIMLPQGTAQGMYLLQIEVDGAMIYERVRVE
ncbi:MAG: PKD domain-containing protein [Bacteroidota bacterium]